MILLRNPLVAAALAAAVASAAVWGWLTLGTIWPLRARVAELAAELDIQRQVAESRAATIATLEASIGRQNAEVAALAGRCTAASSRAGQAALRELARRAPTAPADLQEWNRWLRTDR